MVKKDKFEEIFESLAVILDNHRRLRRYAEGVTLMCALLFVILIVIFYVWTVLR